MKIPVLSAALMLAPIMTRAAEAPSHLFHHDGAAPGEVRTWEDEYVGAGDWWRKEVAAAGFRPFLSYWGDFLANPVGGAAREASWMQLLVVGGEADLEKLLNWKGGSIVGSVTDAAGSNLSLAVGNVFTISQAYVMNTFALYDLYLAQRLLDDRVEIHLGRFSAGQFFATLPAMGLVVSGAVNGNPTSLFLNAPYHATASASWAAHAKVHLSDAAYAEAGVFQASPRIGNPAYHGADFSIRPGDGVLLMAETGWTPTFGRAEKGDAGRKGIYSFGAYFAAYSFATFSGGSVPQAYGFYALGQQVVWRSRGRPAEHVTLWGGMTWSPQEEIAQMPVMAFGGRSGRGSCRDATRTICSSVSIWAVSVVNTPARRRRRAEDVRPWKRCWSSVISFSSQKIFSSSRTSSGSSSPAERGISPMPSWRVFRWD